MTNLMKKYTPCPRFYGIANLALIFGVLVLVGATTAEAIALNRCGKLVRDQAGRETVVNICTQCIAVTLERRRPGQSNGTPNMREFNIPQGSKQLLPFRGPGVTRIVGEAPCPNALGTQ